MNECIFCEIVSGAEPCHKVWESPTHLAFLSIFPNTTGVTVVIPKIHFKSYVFELPEQEMLNLMLATKEVALLLDRKLDTPRTAMVFEGFGVDHVHAKLFPMHGAPNRNEWVEVKSPKDKKNEYFQYYPGYISTHDGKRAKDQELAHLSLRILS